MNVSVSQSESTSTDEDDEAVGHRVTQENGEKSVTCAKLAFVLHIFVTTTLVLLEHIVNSQLKRLHMYHCHQAS